MSLSFKEVAAFGLGAAIGAGVAYVVTENVTRKKYNKYAEDAIAEMKELYEERIQRVQENHVKDIEELSGRINEKIEEKKRLNEKAEYYRQICEAQKKVLNPEPEEEVELSDEPVPAENPTVEALVGKSSLNSSKKKATKKSTKKKEAEPKKVQAPEEHKKMIQDSREITSYAKLISDVDFDNDDDEFDKVNLVYDPNKDVLYDEDDSIVDVEERLGSRDVFDHVGEYYPDKVYVANDYFMQKYEVAYCPDYEPDGF